MSEHISIKGKIDYLHLPRDDKGGVTWCQFCKKTMKVGETLIHDGMCSRWLEMRCSKCNKTIWVAELGKEESMKMDKKCIVCNKPTGDYNCATKIWTEKNNWRYICSKKCDKIHERLN